MTMDMNHIEAGHSIVQDNHVADLRERRVRQQPLDVRQT